jgi:glucose-1-phosphate adenylyltransferase
LVDHVGSGRDWDLTRKIGGVRILTPFSGENNTHGVYKGTLDALYRNLNSIKLSHAQHVVLSGSSMVCNIDYQEVLEKHKESDADITAIYTKSMNGGKTVPRGVAVIKMNKDGRIQDLVVNQDDAKIQDVNWCLDIFIIKKALLETLVADAVSVGLVDFHLDIIKRLAGTLKIQGVESESQFFEISNVRGYMQANMNFLKKAYRDKAFEKPVFTKVKDSFPTLYKDGCYVKNSLIADGCKIEGHVENSIISRGVRVQSSAVVKNSIIMQNTDIQSGARVEYVISDKDVIVREGREVIGHEKYPLLLAKKSIV